MSKEKIRRSKPPREHRTIGHVDHGKTTLTAAITKVLGKNNPKCSSIASIRLTRRRKRKRRASVRRAMTAHVVGVTREEHEVTFASAAECARRFLSGALSI